MAKSFVLSDESINSYGFRILTDGINLENFRKNPIMLWNHTRGYSDQENVILPIGKWENIRVQDKKLIADAVFDTDDDFAGKIAKKVEKGFINMTSVGIRIEEESSTAEHVLPGQTRKTITRCSLREASIVDIGSNANAVVLFDQDDKIMELGADGKCAVGLINNSNQNNKKMELKTIALGLGLSENATEDEVTAKIRLLQDNAKEEAHSAKEKELTDRIAELENEKKEASHKAVVNLVEAAVKEKKITADKKAHFEALGDKMGLESLQDTLSCINAGIKPTDIIGGKTSGACEKKYSEMSEKELSELREKDQNAYEELYEKEFGFKPDYD